MGVCSEYNGKVINAVEVNEAPDTSVDFLSQKSHNESILRAFSNQDGACIVHSD